MVNHSSSSQWKKPVLLFLGVPAIAAAFTISIVLHAILLSVSFKTPEAKPKRTYDRGLEVVLVNARHAKAPDQAELLAQANLDGGGRSEKKVRATTPLPPQKTPRDGTHLIQAQKKVQELERKQQQLLTQAKKTAPAIRVVKDQQDPKPQTSMVTGLDLLDSTAAAARLEAEIDRNLQAYAKRPRKIFVGSRAKEYRFAQYVEDWRQKIERIGTLNYPDSARGKIYGSLLLSLTIRSDGSLHSINIDRSSGHPVLDEAAIRITKLAAPFAAFPPNIKADTDMIVITRTWSFTDRDQLQTD